MNKIRVILYGLAVAFCLFSCGKEMDGPVPYVDKGIVVDFSGIFTKATVEDVGYESQVNHLDILVFEAATGGLYWHERASVTSSEGSHTLSVGSGFFAEKNASGAVVSHPKYNVRVLANCSFDMQFSPQDKTLTVSGTDGEGNAMVSEVTNLGGFANIIQEDINLHMSGLNLPSVPTAFLMDAVAKVDGVEDVSLSSEQADKNIVLTAALSRAASKVVINIREGRAIEFTEGDDLERQGLFADSEHGLYYIRNLPYRTTLLPVSRETGTDDLITTIKSNNAHFTWNPSAFTTDTTKVKGDGDKKDVVTIVTYVYEHTWKDRSVFEYEPCAVVNLPMIFVEGDSHYHVHANSWYKIPLTKGDNFGRNMLYKVNVEINYAGATTVMEPVVVPDISYEVLGYEDVDAGWQTETVGVSQTDRPKYLTVSHDEIEMHNSEETSMVAFSSSADVDVVIDEIYYYNKFGQKIAETSLDGVSVSASEGLFGNITVRSPRPANNAPRYIRIKVSNSEADDRYLLVIQYPLEHITNIQGYYSYREDFGGTTYESYSGNRYVSVGGWNQNTLSWSTYSANYDYFNGCLFMSKVAELRNDGSGKSDISYYRWTRYGWNGYRLATESAGTTLINGRMYHVKLASSSSEYSVGIPKMDSRGWTDSGDDNKKLVSPSFMIASQLGATYAPSSMEQAASHCANYVETYKDEGGKVIHLNDWRLPTEEEIKIIIRFQYMENAAMDEVLRGQRYWSATGLVENTESTSTDNQSAVRCIRNAF